MSYKKVKEELQRGWFHPFLIHKILYLRIKSNQQKAHRTQVQWNPILRSLIQRLMYLKVKKYSMKSQKRIQMERVI